MKRPEKFLIIALFSVLVFGFSALGSWEDSEEPPTVDECLVAAANQCRIFENDPQLWQACINLHLFGCTGN